MENLIVVGPRTPKENYKEYRVINTTSSSKTKSRELSPFILGPVKLYGNYVSKNVENGWQYSKVYADYCDFNGPTDSYFKWAEQGWNKSFADRYPMGKGAIPKYSYWEMDGKPEHLDYISARKKIYAPIYSEAVKNTEAFKILENLYKKDIRLALWDYDGYNHFDFQMTFEDVINRTNLKMGHAFVLYGLLKDKIKCP